MDELKKDPRINFFEMEEIGKANIEAFMEFAWKNRDRQIDIDQNNLPPVYINGCRVTSAGGNSVKFHGMEEQDSFWGNFLYHGLGNPISFMMLQCFHENGKGWNNFLVSRSIAKHLKNGDLVLNLNYDTIFELSLQQENIDFLYTPNN
jgi:hypothetical protein